MPSLISTSVRRLSTWAGGSINRWIFAAALTMGGFTLLVKLAEVFMELISAFQLSVGRELDTLRIIRGLPTFLTPRVWRGNPAHHAGDLVSAPWRRGTRREPHG